MNYVNIKGQRINLCTIIGYSFIGELVFIELPLPHADYKKEGLPNGSIQLEFDSEEEAKECINFLDNKTQCETFMLP